MVRRIDRRLDGSSRMLNILFWIVLWTLSFYSNNHNVRAFVPNLMSQQSKVGSQPQTIRQLNARQIDDEMERIEKEPSNSESLSSSQLKSFNPQTPALYFLIPTVLSLLISTPAIAMDTIPLATPNADPRYFLAGGICAAASHGATTPLDVIKTKIQSDPETLGSKSWGVAARTILEEEGPQVLLAGLVPTIVGYGLEGALKFGLYESLKPTFGQLLSDPTEGFLVASVTAGAVASIVLCPMEQTRIRLVTDTNFANGFGDGVKRLIREEGPLALFFGLPAMLSKQVPYTMAKQVSFDLIAGILYGFAVQYSLSEASIRTEVEFLAAFGASVLACIASHPGDVILTATYKDGSVASESGLKGIISQLYDQNGVKSFFAGITARFYHVGAIITSQLILYDIVKQMLGLPATGTH